MVLQSYRKESKMINGKEWYLHIHLALGFMNNNYSFLFCLLYRRAAWFLRFGI